MDTIGLSEYCERVLDLQNAKLSDEYFYQSLPLCVIDAVFSLGVRYESTRQTVIKYCNYYNLQRIRVDKESVSITEQESISQFIEKVESAGIDFITTKVFDNRQRTSSKNGILKTEAVLKFAKTLQKYGVNYLQDIPMIVNDAEYEESIKTITGQKSGISLKYFLMLSGSENIIKPDRHIKKFINNAIKIDADIYEAQILLSNTCEKLKVKYPHLTPRLLDNLIWKYQASNKNRQADKIKTQGRGIVSSPVLVNNLLHKDEMIGPYKKSRIVLCSADAGPNSQSDMPCSAEYFFPGAKWVGAVRNAAQNIGCRFVILTTAHGMVNPTDMISPYDLHGQHNKKQVSDIWNKSVPQIIDNNCDLLVFYAGGVPKELYLELFVPILRDLKIDLITFGRPNMYDVGKISEIAKALQSSVSMDELRDFLKCPEKLIFISWKDNN